ncbi:MAG: hypothetical protein KGI41_01170 [Patescibacteria group bacterium]|nr:hypothetical protein [Patescibacteria group bacterium]MDE1965837.1 hypothetical protein [Patescibacteria group bacterium]
MRRHAFVKDSYHALVTLPDRMYPFRARVRGQWVRGTRAYDAALNRSFRRYGRGRYGYSLSLYRALFHLAGALLILFFAAFISQRFFGNAAALYVVLALTTAFITFQEFYLQRRIYRQLWRKGIFDWFTWLLPLGLYLFTHLH